jgi:hypothetical protein
MSLFRNPPGPPASPEPDDPNRLPVETFDLSKRYDIYCSVPGEDRLYESVKIVGIRTFQKPKNEYGGALISGYLEIESVNGARMMIQNIRINLICEHGSAPEFTVLRVRNSEY